MDEVRPFPPGIKESVNRAIERVGAEKEPFVVLARADNRKMFVAARVNGNKLSFGGYLEKEYQHPLKYGVEAVWYPGKK